MSELVAFEIFRLNLPDLSDTVPISFPTMPMFTYETDFLSRIPAPDQKVSEHEEWLIQTGS